MFTGVDQDTGINKVMLPAKGTLIHSPLEIRSQARGDWFFEGDFPVVLVDQQGHRLAVGYAKALGEWMTKAFVPFASELYFEAPAINQGRLILMEDNPSELPEPDATVEIPRVVQ